MAEQSTPKMTHDEMIDVLKGLVFGTFDRTTAKEREALDMAISALSGGEYIKKSELLQHVTTEELSDYKDCDVIHAEEIDKLTTYSFPDSAEELTEDGTLTVHVADGSKINRVLVMGENIFGGLYYPDSAENKGHWGRRIVDNGFNADWVCSECGHREYTDFIHMNFCPNCGADMREPKGEKGTE